MSDISLLMNDLDQYNGSELLTNSQSIIKAINELYVNQQILFATSKNLFQKINVSIGDLTEDEELKQAYIRLEFNNIIDGLVKLENALQKGLDDGSAGTLAKINAIKEQIGELEDDSELAEIFRTMGWDNLSDGLIKVNQRITDFITNATSNTASVTVALRDSIVDLRNIVGTLENDPETREAFHKTRFNNILAAIVELNSIIGFNTAAEEAFNQTEFESILDLVIDVYNVTTNNTQILNDYSQAESEQAAVIAAKLEKFNKNLTNIDDTVRGLVTDITDIQSHLQLQSDYMRTGFENVLVSLQKMDTSVNNIVKLIGDLTIDAELKNKYDATGYTSMVDGLCRLSVITNYLINILGNVDLDTDLADAFNETGYQTVIEAVIDINNILGNMSTNNILKAAFIRLGYKNVAEGLVQLSDSLDVQLTSINQLRGQLIAHEIDVNAHSELIPTFLMHFTNKAYQRGERVFIKEMPNYMYLECVSDNGVTAQERPDFAAILAD